MARLCVAALIALPLRWAPCLGATLSLPSDSGAAPGASVVVPLSVDDASGMLGTDIVITYDAGVALARAVTPAPVAAGQSLTVNLSQPGVVRISLYGPFPLAGGGVLLSLSFQAVGPAGSSTPLDLVSADLNEGAIPVRLVSGRYCVRGAPGEPRDLQVAQVDGSTAALLGWDAVPFALAYNVYRGARTDLQDLACFIPGVGSLSIADDGAVPPEGAVFVYLVTAIACGGESTLGSDSSGVERQNGAPCP